MTLSSSFDYRLIDITMSNKNVIKLHRQHFLKECKKKRYKKRKAQEGSKGSKGTRVKGTTARKRCRREH